MSNSVAMSVDGEKKKKRRREAAETEAETDETSTTATTATSGEADRDLTEKVEVIDRADLAISVIAHPLANKKLTKKCLKLVKKASKVKGLRRGVKEVVKAIRKGEKGVLLLAGNISPIDVISHLPVLCEDSEIPYVYVPSKEELGSAGSTKRPTSCVLVQNKAGNDYAEYFEEVRKEVIKLAPPNQ